MVRDVVRDCLEKEPSDRTESDIREFSFSKMYWTIVYIFLLNVLRMHLTNSVYFLSFAEALLDFMQHLPVGFCFFVLNQFVISNAFLTTKHCSYHALY